jgi:hypothetical protein
MTRRARLRQSKPKKPRFNSTPLVGSAIIVLAAMVAVGPQIITGPTCNGDFYFHFVSWADAQRSMLQGILYPRWANSPNFGFGEPRFVFYPPLTWMAGALMGTVLSWKHVSIAFSFLLLAVTGLATRKFAREVMEDGPATLAGCAAIFLGRGLSDISLRCDYAELTGGFWIPLLLLFLLRNRNPSGQTWARAFDGSTVPVALVMAGIWLSNGPLGIEANYLAAAIALLAAALERSWAPIARAAVGVTLGMSLAAFYLVPAVWERSWANIQEAVTRREFLVENSWLFGHHADSSWWAHDRLLLKISEIAAAMFAVTAVSAVVAWKRGTLPGERRWLVSLLAIPCAVLFLLLPVSLPAWNWLPELRLLQFPWRWLLVMQSSLAVFFALAVWVTTPRRRIAILAGCAVLFLVISPIAWSFGFADCRVFDAKLLGWEEQGGAYGKPEYSPPGIQYSVVLPDVPSNCVVRNLKDLAGISGAPGEDLHAVRPESKNNCEGNFGEELNLPELKAFDGVADEAGYLILRLRSYPAWQATVNGHATSATLEPGHGMMAVPVPPGRVNVVVRWTTTPDVVAGRWLSALAAFLLIALHFAERKLAVPRDAETKPTETPKRKGKVERVR